jgi:hypothetical protein
MLAGYTERVKVVGCYLVGANLRSMLLQIVKPVLNQCQTGVNTQTQ